MILFQDTIKLDTSTILPAGIGTYLRLSPVLVHISSWHFLYLLCLISLLMIFLSILLLEVSSPLAISMDIATMFIYLLPNCFKEFASYRIFLFSSVTVRTE